MTTHTPYYVLTAQVICKAPNGRPIPWSEPIMEALEQSHLLIEHGWRRSSDSQPDTMTTTLPVVEDATFSPTDEESIFLTVLHDLAKSGETYGVGDLRVKFCNDTVVLIDGNRPMRLNERRVAVLL